MEVIYKKSIFEKVQEAKAEAQANGKTIDRIVLSYDEAIETTTEVGKLAHMVKPAFELMFKVQRGQGFDITFLGVNLVREPEDEPEE